MPKDNNFLLIPHQHCIKQEKGSLQVFWIYSILMVNHKIYWSFLEKNCMSLSSDAQRVFCQNDLFILKYISCKSDYWNVLQHFDSI